MSLIRSGSRRRIARCRLPPSPPRDPLPHSPSSRQPFVPPIHTKQRSDFAAVYIIEITGGTSSSSKNVYLMVKRPEDGLLAGLWEFPSVLVDEEETDMGTIRRTMNEYLKKLFDVDVGRNCNVMLREDVGEYLHVFSHIRLRMHVELLTLSVGDGLNLIENEEQCSTTWKFVDGNSIRGVQYESGFQAKKSSQQRNIVARKRTKRSTGVRLFFLDLLFMAIYYAQISASDTSSEKRLMLLLPLAVRCLLEYHMFG